MNRLWRRLASGIGFFTFGALGVFFQFLLFPGIILFVHPTAKRKILARRVVHATFLWFVKYLRFLGILDWETKGLEKLQKPGQLILANHLTLLDVVFLFAMVPNACAIVKAPLTRNPFTAGALRAAGYIVNDGGYALVDRSIEELRTGASLIVFPEGTRTPWGEEPKLKHGAMATALKGRISPTIVRIGCEPLGLFKGAPWWYAPEKPMRFTFEVVGVLPVAPFLPGYAQCPPKAVRALARSVYNSIFLHYPHVSTPEAVDDPQNGQPQSRAQSASDRRAQS